MTVPALRLRFLAHNCSVLINELSNMTNISYTGLSEA